MSTTVDNARARGKVIRANLVKFYVSRGHTEEEAASYADRHLKGDSGFVSNPPPKVVPVLTEEEVKS